jgi:hypothetical protein
MDNTTVEKIIIQSDDRKELENIKDLFHGKNHALELKNGYYELSFQLLEEDDMKTIKRHQFDLDDEYDLPMAYIKKSGLGIFDMYYDWNDIHQVPLCGPQLQFRDQNFNPFEYMQVHSKKKPVHMKDALIMLIDDIRKEDKLKPVSHLLKETKLYKEMINEILKNVMNGYYYNINHLESSGGIEEVNQVINDILPQWETFKNISYQMLKKIMVNN